MSLDWGDLLWRVSARWGVQVSPDDLVRQAGLRSPPDLSLADLVKLACQSSRICRACRYDLRAHGASGACPECGLVFGPIDADECFRVIAQCLHDAMAIPLADIAPESLLIADLGCG